MYDLRCHQLAQALGGGDEKTFFPDTNAIKSNPTRSSMQMHATMQHKDKSSLKVVLTFIDLCVACVAELNPKVIQSPL